MIFRILPLLGIVAVLIISGCIGGISPEEIAKMTGEVQSFLDDYPNAEVTASYLDEEYVESTITELRGMCGEQMKIQPYWRVVFKDTDTDINITVWMEGENRNTVCFHKEGKEPEEPGIPVDDTVAKKVIDYLNDNIVPSGTLASLISVEEESGIYVIRTIYGGKEIIVYATKDGTLLIVGTVYDISGEYETPPTDKNDIAMTVVKYLNDNIISLGSSCSLISIEDTNRIYTVKTLYQGSEVPVYVTKDGALLFIGIVYDMTQIPEPPTQPEQPTETVGVVESCNDQDIVKTTKPTLMAWVVSMCPFGTQAMNGMYYVQDHFGDEVDVVVRYITSILGNGEPTAMHGADEHKENERQVCIRDEQPSLFWDYIHCYVESGNTASCEDSTGIDSDALTDCINNRGKEKMINEAAEWATIYQPAGGKGSPSFFLNGVSLSEYSFGSNGRSPNNLKNIACCAMEIPVYGCNTQLNTANPPRGYGAMSTDTIPQPQPTTECSNIDVIIQGATYDFPTSTLNLYVKNMGTIQLTFDTLIKYQNGTVTHAGQNYTVDANQLRTFTFTGISNTVDEVTIQSQECTNVQDLIQRQWITGL